MFQLYRRSRILGSVTLLLYLYFPSPYVLYYNFALATMILLDTNDRLGERRWYVAATRTLHQLSTATYSLLCPIDSSLTTQLRGLQLSIPQSMCRTEALSDSGRARVASHGENKWATSTARILRTRVPNPATMGTRSAKPDANAGAGSSKQLTVS